MNYNRGPVNWIQVYLENSLLGVLNGFSSDSREVAVAIDEACETSHLKWIETTERSHYHEIEEHDIRGLETEAIRNLCKRVARSALIPEYSRVITTVNNERGMWCVSYNWLCVEAKSFEIGEMIYDCRAFKEFPGQLFKKPIDF